MSNPKMLEPAVPQILEVIEGAREKNNLTRAQMAEAMTRESGEEWTKEKLDKALTGCSCPRAETLFLMFKVVGLGTWPWHWCRSVKRVKRMQPS